MDDLEKEYGSLVVRQVRVGGSEYDDDQASKIVNILEYRRMKPTWRFLFWFWLAMAFWFFVVFMLPIFQTNLLYPNVTQEIVRPASVAAGVAALGYECGVGLDEVKTTCTWQMYDQQACRQFAGELLQIIRRSDRKFDLIVGISLPVMGAVNLLLMVYLRARIRALKRRVHACDAAGQGGWYASRKPHNSNGFQHVLPPDPGSGTPEREPPDLESGTPDREPHDITTSRSKHRRRPTILQLLYNFHEMFFGFLWERVPEVKSTWAMRTELDLIALISVCVTMCGFALLIEEWIIWSAEIERYAATASYTKLSDQRPDCYSIYFSPINRSVVQIVEAVLLAFFFIYFVIKKPTEAYRRTKQRLNNDGTVLPWTFIRSWTSFLTTGGALFLVQKSLKMDATLISPTVRLLEAILGFSLLAIQLLESYLLEHIAHLDGQGELMTSPIPDEFNTHEVKLPFLRRLLQLGSCLFAPCCGQRVAAACARSMSSCGCARDAGEDVGEKEPTPPPIEVPNADEIHVLTRAWYEQRKRLLGKRLPMLVIRKCSDSENVYRAIIQPLGARLAIGATSFRYDTTKEFCTIRLQVGGVVYTWRIQRSAADALEYAAKCRPYVWCDAISVTFLRLLDPKMAKDVFDNMAKIYKFYTCVPSLNWVVDDMYTTRGWMWQEFICGELLVRDRIDKATLGKILEMRGDKDKDSGTDVILKRKTMTVHLISSLLTSAVEHYNTCAISKDDDLPNACFGLLTSYGLFKELPQNQSALVESANMSKSQWGEWSLHPLRLLMRAIIRLRNEKRGIECAVQFVASDQGKKKLQQRLQRGRKDPDLRGEYDAANLASCHHVGVAAAVAVSADAHYATSLCSHVVAEQLQDTAAP